MWYREAPKSVGQSGSAWLKVLPLRLAWDCVQFMQWHGCGGKYPRRTENLPHFLVLPICLAVVAVASCVFAVQASIASDPERLACLEAIANKKGHAAPTEVTRDERTLIIARCLSQTGEFGSAMGGHVSNRTWRRMWRCWHTPRNARPSLSAAPSNWGSTGGAWSKSASTRLLKRSGLWQIDRGLNPQVES